MISRVLLVDDDQDIQVVARLALEAVAGWDVKAVEDPREAVGAALEFGPDVMLLDWMMPGMTGLELYGELKSQPELSGVPVIFLTAKVQPADRELLAEVGASLISKPFDPMQLAVQVSKLASQPEAGAA